jgi:hypothetical protein
MLIERMICVAAAFVLSACGGGGDGKSKGKDDDAPGKTVAVDSAGGRAAPAAGDVCRVGEGSRPLDGVHESSGVAVSRRNAGVFWTHNDSGQPALHAIGSDGREVGKVRVAGAQVEDWEDVALAPCPGGGDCLYVADIGDNAAKRAEVTVYRVPEPAPGDAGTRPAEALRLRYPDGAHDAEALFVLPDGSLNIVTKGETGPVALYTAAAPAAGETATLRRVRELAGGEVKKGERITGASASADGRWVALRTHHEVSIYPAAGFLSGGAVTARTVDVRELNEAQGEGVGFAPDGGLVLTSEGGKKKDPATFARLACTLQ